MDVKLYSHKNRGLFTVWGGIVNPNYGEKPIRFWSIKDGKDCTKTDGAELQADPGSGLVEYPASHSFVFEMLCSGEQVTVVQVYGAWARVRTADNREGWVYTA